jgi:F0F1-type ATP synthase membrane subunit c/vacuolar-type H+-ATPase subunit K
LEVLLKGKNIASSIAGKLASPFVYKYDLVSSAASSLPDVLASKGHLVGQILAAPVDFTAKKSALLAKGLAYGVVGLPAAIGSGVAAAGYGLAEAWNNVQEQKEKINNCLNPTPKDPCLENKVNKIDEKVVVVQPSASVDHIQADEPRGESTTSIPVIEDLTSKPEVLSTESSIEVLTGGQF